METETNDDNALVEDNDFREDASPDPEVTLDEAPAPDTKVDSSNLGFQDFVDKRNEGKVTKESKPDGEVAGLNGSKPNKEVKAKEFSEENPEEEELHKEVAPKVGRPKIERDYSGLDAEEQGLFEKMANSAFQKLKPIYLEYKKLKSAPAPEDNPLKLPSNYYSHPKAYQLAPEYESAAANVNLAEMVLNHWEAQSISVRRNGKFRELLQDKEGNFSLGEEKEATETDEARVNREVRGAQNQLGRYQKAHEQLVTTFNGEHEKAANVIKNAEEQFFRGFNEKDHPTQEMQKKILELIPPPFRTSPVTSLLVKTGAANALLMAENKSLKAELAKLKGIKQDTRQAPPTKKNFLNQSNGSAQLNIGMDDFAKRRNAG